MNFLSAFGNRQSDRYCVIFYLVVMVILPIGLPFIPGMTSTFIICIMAFYVVYGIFMHIYRDDNYVEIE